MSQKALSNNIGAVLRIRLLLLLLLVVVLVLVLGVGVISREAVLVLGTSSREVVLVLLLVVLLPLLLVGVWVVVGARYNTWSSHRMHRILSLCHDPLTHSALFACKIHQRGILHPYPRLVLR
jgi:hypothetical protein